MVDWYRAGVDVERELPKLSAYLGHAHVNDTTLRHSRAMSLLQHGVDRSVIALWLGHESVETTQICLHADISLKEKALAHTTPTKQAPARYRPGDKLLEFLEGL